MRSRPDGNAGAVDDGRDIVGVGALHVEGEDRTLARRIAVDQQRIDARQPFMRIGGKRRLMCRDALAPEAKAVLAVLTRATLNRAAMSRDLPVSKQTVLMPPPPPRRPFVPVLLPILAVLAVLSTTFLVSTIAYVNRGGRAHATNASTTGAASGLAVTSPEPPGSAGSAQPVDAAQPDDPDAGTSARPGAAGSAKKLWKGGPTAASGSSP